MGLMALRAGLGFVPVLTFAAILYSFDDFRLVGPRLLIEALLAGAGAAVFCLLLNPRLIAAAGMGAAAYSRYAAPLIEESAKALYLFVLLRRRRLGFLVDAAIVGFAIGAGFALFENVTFLRAAVGAAPVHWLIRGFGTAVMHGGTVALVGILAKAAAERAQRERALDLLPGLAVAVLVHSLYNHFPLRGQMLASILFLVALPLTVLLVYRRSERSLRRWLEAGFGGDLELLQMLREGKFLSSNIGRYLQSLRDRLPGYVLADMLCALQLHVELSIKAKAVLLLQEQEIPLPDDPGVGEKFRELAALRRSIGPLGWRLLAPLLHATPRELWQLRMLRARSAG